MSDHATIDRLIRERDEARENERALSAAYVRLRVILGAIDPPTTRPPAALWAYVEGVARARVAACAAAPAPAEAVAHSDKRVTAIMALVDEFAEAKRRAPLATYTADVRAEIERSLRLPVDAAPAAPAGWQLVPVKPTPEMLRAAITAWAHSAPMRGTSADNPQSAGHRAWRAALAAAPGAPQGDAS